jgi:CHAT domain-containing protein/tetratricopeptide (TPR) repeat protein
MKSLCASLALLGSLALGITGCGHATPPKNQQFEQIRKELLDLVHQGEIEAAAPRYRKAAEDAQAKHFSDYQVKFLSNLATCQLLLYQFQASLKTMETARAIAKRVNDDENVAGLDSNMSSLFLEMNNLEEAAKAAEDGVANANALETRKRAVVVGQLAAIRAEQGRLEDFEPQFKRAIDLSREAKDSRTEALMWDKLAWGRYKAKKYKEARDAVQVSLDLRKRLSLGNIAYSYMILGMIRAGEKDLGSALDALNESEREIRKPGNLTPQWLVYMERGKVKIHAADYKSALDDLRQSLALAREWRVDVPPNDANRTSSEVRLAELYQSLVEAGNRLYLNTHEPALIRETFEAAEENRAASLRALLPQESDWRKKLPVHYYELLYQSQLLQTQQMSRGESHASTALLDLRSQLAQIEASVGGGQRQRQTKAIDQAQGMLDSGSALFSFQLGDENSWMWAVTKDGIALHALPARGELAPKIVNFEKAVGSNSADLEKLSGDLYKCLFGSVSPDTLARERWLVALDGPLFDLPFPALSAVPGRFLIEDHSFQIAPGALMLKSGGHQGPATGGFLAVGDPVYNLADPRAKTSGAWPSWSALLTRVSDGRGPAFARLWGTAKEIQTSAHAWNAPATTLLTGKQVSPEIFWDKTLANPDIIHIATHILEENEKPKTGWIAFSLGPDGQVQYVTPEDILAKSISARLVVLSGCSSGKADIQPATGLMGLTRAWIAAGAGAVLATRWPTVDDDGAFFESFYRNLRHLDQINSAEALRSASLEMLKSGTWRANPSLWAGYFLIGNY